jgi:hypothetical protein
MFSPSGGILYHLRAWRRQRLWRSFTVEVAEWLRDWPLRRDHLLLIGPSAGYTLPLAWLNSFARIDAYDIDPFAGWLLKRRLPKAKFHRADMFWQNGALSTAPLKEALAFHRRAHPGATVCTLFSNVLGQVRLERAVTDPEWDRFLVELRQTLTELPWASYHDLYTVEPLTYQEHLALGNCLRGLQDPSQIKQIKWTKPFELLDHTTGGRWTEGLQKTRMIWSLHRKSLHIIEAVRK